MKVIPVTCLAHLSWYLCFYYYHWVDTPVGGLLVPEGIIRPYVSVSAPTLFIRYIHCRNLQLLNYWIIIKSKVVLPQAYVTLADLAILFRSFGVYAHKLFGFQILWNWAHLMKVIPETRRAH